MDQEKEKEPLESSSEAPEAAGPNQPFLVLAEDDEEIRIALTELLVDDGFEVACVANGKLLVDLLSDCEKERRMPDVIVTDHRMPGYSGVEVLEGLRRVGWNIPVIMITAFGREVGDLAKRLGASAVFQKPFDPDDLRTAALYSSRITKQLEKKKGRDRA